MVHFDINLSHWIAQDQAKELEKEVKAEVFRARRRIGVTSRDAFTQTDSKKKFVAQVTHCYQRIFDGLCDEPGPVQVGCDPHEGIRWPNWLEVNAPLITRGDACFFSGVSMTEAEVRAASLMFLPYPQVYPQWLQWRLQLV